MMEHEVVESWLKQNSSEPLKGHWISKGAYKSKTQHHIKRVKWKQTFGMRHHKPFTLGSCSKQKTSLAYSSSNGNCMYLQMQQHPCKKAKINRLYSYSNNERLLHSKGTRKFTKFFKDLAHVYQP